MQLQPWQTKKGQIKSGYDSTGTIVRAVFKPSNAEYSRSIYCQVHSFLSRLFKGAAKLALLHTKHA